LQHPKCKYGRKIVGAPPVPQRSSSYETTRTLQSAGEGAPHPHPTPHLIAAP